ncbi:hypothetical protein L596_017677 [Steinernema carpocapsae]|uniref:Uncharacterized protein n=1 Tax=Steinernema carpocapsae TaxID=34508 RepID=A0A4U5N2Q1_STECR|nr:hypothetical protein L596_017677 [Steinernema carpocapsae]
MNNVPVRFLESVYRILFVPPESVWFDLSGQYKNVACHTLDNHLDVTLIILPEMDEDIHVEVQGRIRGEEVVELSLSEICDYFHLISRMLFNVHLTEATLLSLISENQDFSMIMNNLHHIPQIDVPFIEQFSAPIWNRLFKKKLFCSCRQHFNDIGEVKLEPSSLPYGGFEFAMFQLQSPRNKYFELYAQENDDFVTILDQVFPLLSLYPQTCMHFDVWNGTTNEQAVEFSQILLRWFLVTDWKEDSSDRYLNAQKWFRICRKTLEDNGCKVWQEIDDREYDDLRGWAMNPSNPNRKIRWQISSYNSSFVEMPDNIYPACRITFL